MSEIKAVIFDFDGVIFSTPKISYPIWKKIFDGLGIEFSEEIYRKKFQGARTSEKVPRILKEHSKYSEELVEKILEDRENVKREVLNDIENKDFEDMIIPGSIDFLKQVKDGGLKMTLVTSSVKETAMVPIKRLGIEDFFDVLLFAGDVKKGKPDPEAFLLAAKKMGVEPKSCIVFEDAVNGLKAAKNAGMRVVAVNSSNNYEDLKRENPERIINNFENINLGDFIE
ncbi:MAG: HAD-IA family hydrolase [Candidatus Aenigmarchaeota archaeon]|nr:HAD-IA family hydrolase [Candidatus Aenigmarchaeota archaeon]NIQ17281.1 HAD-IA family hydrolase [Candidatus Aenigmarchaeota archaeon]NIS73142.1 HAD-IA family hydrolase [Candidatus Aenigmarchaeota archaeon]